MIDFFNRRALMERDIEIESLKEEIDIQKTEIERLTAKLRGDRVCDGCCSVCKHSIASVYAPSPAFPGIMPYATYSCELDCKCKDFERAH